MTNLNTARRLARLAGVACLAMPLAAHAEESAGPQIVVTGNVGEISATEESRSAEELRETTSVMTADDSLRYLPSLLVRRRHVGDTQAPLATRTSGVGASARSLIYADGVLLSALIGNNNSTASPRWGMVSPEEIDHVDVLYGPFSAAYPGNSIGAVVNIATRLPEKTEATLALTTSVQAFDQYGTDATYPSAELAATFGTHTGPLSLFVAANHLDSRGQPLAYATVARPSASGTAGVPVTGAIETLNRSGNPIYVLGATGIEHQIQDNLTLKASLEPVAGLRLTWLGGLFLNDTDADAKSYLDGGSQFAGTFNINVAPGQTKTVTGGCTLPSGVNQQLFALWPHMHQYATHQKVQLTHGAVTSTLLDHAYSFSEQAYYPQQPLVPVAGGDRNAVSCTYTNTSSSTITFGDSSNQEMCFSGMYFYPARGANIFDCAGF